MGREDDKERRATKNGRNRRVYELLRVFRGGLDAIETTKRDTNENATQTRLLNNKTLDARTLEGHLGGRRRTLKRSLTEAETNSRARLEGRKKSMLCRMCRNYNKFCSTTERRNVGIVKSSRGI